MKKYIIIIFTILYFFQSGFAQRTCGTFEVYNAQLQTDPVFKMNRETIGVLNERFKINKENRVFRQAEINIPVVIHVVYNKARLDQKISKQQIISQIEVLNADYSSKNTDLDNVPKEFSHLIAPNQGIKFSLAVRDPLGNMSEGIEYIETSIDGFSTNDDVKFKTKIGADAWPRDEYLNIWVCKLKGDVLGYAQFPGGPEATDGVVIQYTAFGTNGTVTAPFDKGRTATHEVGHWLDLFHIWGDDGSACSGGDQITDTPNQAGPNFYCPLFPHISCKNSPNGDLFVNYMDYVDDVCMVMFTKEQALRISSTLQHARNTLASSSGVINPAVKIKSVRGLQLKSYK